MAAAVSRAAKCHDLAEKNTGGKQISLHDVLQLVESILSLQYLPQFETIATTMFFSSWNNRMWVWNTYLHDVVQLVEPSVR